jgi:hypothetical protein
MLGDCSLLFPVGSVLVRWLVIILEARIIVE